jgi:hypothetical protein
VTTSSSPFRGTKPAKGTVWTFEDLFVPSRLNHRRAHHSVWPERDETKHARLSARTRPDPPPTGSPAHPHLTQTATAAPCCGFLHHLQTSGTLRLALCAFGCCRRRHSFLFVLLSHPRLPPLPFAVVGRSFLLCQSTSEMGLRLPFKQYFQTINVRMATTAIPPMTPPAIAPTLVVLLVSGRAMGFTWQPTEGQSLQVRSD